MSRVLKRPHFCPPSQDEDEFFRFSSFRKDVPVSCIVSKGVVLFFSESGKLQISRP
uniref:Uncharacterized protein n=1 Tax=Anguilla anguilla TaxID=7936 RepID=A0A0E9WNA3_ANGAN